jgi:hypothetical protein
MGRFSIEELKAIAKTLFLKAIASVDPYQKLKEILKLDKDHLQLILSEGPVKELDLRSFKNIRLVGAGKASASMAQAIEEVFGDRIAKESSPQMAIRAAEPDRSHGQAIPSQTRKASLEPVRSSSSSKIQVLRTLSSFSSQEGPLHFSPCLPKVFCSKRSRKSPSSSSIAGQISKRSIPSGNIFHRSKEEGLPNWPIPPQSLDSFFRMWSGTLSMQLVPVPRCRTHQPSKKPGRS